MAKKNKTRGSKNVPNTVDFNPKQIAPDISVRNMDTFLFQQGIRVKVYTTLWCPKRLSIDGAEHDISCPLCRGTEFIDLDPVDTFAGLQSQTQEQLINPDDLGYNWKEQTVLATFSSGIELSYYTKVELTDYTNVHKELIQRQPGDIEVIASFTPTSYTASTGVVLVPDALDLNLVTVGDIFVDSTSARFVIRGGIDNTTGSKQFLIKKNRTVSAASGATIRREDIDRLQFKAFCVDIVLDEDGLRYYEGKDFQIDRNGDLQWISGGAARKPADKKIYSIHYNTSVAYRAIRAIHSNRFGTESEKTTKSKVAEYPQQWVLKKLFLFKKEDSESGQQLDPNKIFPPE